MNGNKTVPYPKKNPTTTANKTTLPKSYILSQLTNRSVTVLPGIASSTTRRATSTVGKTFGVVCTVALTFAFQAKHFVSAFFRYVFNQQRL